MPSSQSFALWWHWGYSIWAGGSMNPRQLPSSDPSGQSARPSQNWAGLMQREDPGHWTEGLVQETWTGIVDSFEATLTVGGLVSGASGKIKLWITVFQKWCFIWSNSYCHFDKWQILYRNSPHPSSSDPSPQSVSPSQMWLKRTHWVPSAHILEPLWHFGLLVWSVGGAMVGQNISSEPSEQWERPSHTKLLGTQLRRSLHAKSAEEDNIGCKKMFLAKKVGEH